MKAETKIPNIRNKELFLTRQKCTLFSCYLQMKGWGANMVDIMTIIMTG